MIADMLLDLRQKPVEVWTVAKPDGPAYSGTLARIVVGPGGEQPGEDVTAGAVVLWLGLRDDRGLDIRIVGEAVVAVVARG
jgi:hypothetical protein